jgi:KDO2-lipid IV(A) lauroyltransferase
MAAKKRSAMLDYLVYVLVRIVVCVIQALPFDTARGLARLLAWLVHRVDKRHRLVAADNLRASFGNDYSEAEIDQMVRHVYLHFCTMLIEIMFFPRKLHLHNYKQSIYIRDKERIADLILSGRPVLFVTGHFGNWELAGYTVGMLGLKSYAIARPLDNPYVDDFLRAFREKTGQKLLAKQGDFDQIEKVLADGNVLGTLADQDAGQRGLFVNFFGRPASTHKAIALLALEHNVPMVIGGMPRLDGQYCLTALDVIYPEDYDKSPDAVRAITQRFTSCLETLIREAPEQYFWVHRRWKHQPQVRKRKQAA